MRRHAPPTGHIEGDRPGFGGAHRGDKADNFRKVTLRLFVVSVVAGFLGMALSSGMAWTCFLRGRFGSQQTLPTTKADTARVLSELASAVDEDWEVFDETAVFRKFGAELRIVGAVETRGVREQRMKASRVECGWPLSSFYCDVYERLQSEATKAGQGTRRQIGLAQLPWLSRSGQGIHVPIRVVWQGFVGNSALFAVIVGLVLVAFRACRILSRRARGLCTACGYPVRESSTCPECGRRHRFVQATAPSSE